jgi:hypothetical protein
MLGARWRHSAVIGAGGWVQLRRMVERLVDWVQGQGSRAVAGRALRASALGGTRPHRLQAGRR